VEALTIESEDPHAHDVRALLETHLAFAHATTPPEAVHALEHEALSEPHVTFFTAREHGRLLGISALRELDPGHAEVKSMHVAAAARGRGVGAAMVAHLLALARGRGYQRLSLETGSGEDFAAARSLYARAGFTLCPAFGDYPPSEHSTFMTLAL
jgi:putative acetyltransferase